MTNTVQPPIHKISLYSLKSSISRSLHSYLRNRRFVVDKDGRRWFRIEAAHIGLGRYRVFDGSRRPRDQVQVDVEDVELPEELVDDDADREMHETRRYRRHASFLCSQVAADDRGGARGRIGRTCREKTS